MCTDQMIKWWGMRRWAKYNYSNFPFLDSSSLLLVLILFSSEEMVRIKFLIQACKWTEVLQEFFWRLIIICVRIVISYQWRGKKVLKKSNFFGVCPKCSSIKTCWMVIKIPRSSSILTVPFTYQFLYLSFHKNFNSQSQNL